MSLRSSIEVILKDLERTRYEQSFNNKDLMNQNRQCQAWYAQGASDEANEIIKELRRALEENKDDKRG